MLTYESENLFLKGILAKNWVWLDGCHMTQNNFSTFPAGICDKPRLFDGLMTTRRQAWRFG